MTTIPRSPSVAPGSTTASGKRSFPK
jgi:hypothetical protein